MRWRGMNFDVIDYLLKPIAFDRFLNRHKRHQSIIQPSSKPEVKAEAAPQNDFLSDFIFVKTEHKIQKVYLNDIPVY